MKKLNTSPISGMQELLPEKQAIFNNLKNKIVINRCSARRAPVLIQSSYKTVCKLVKQFTYGTVSVDLINCFCQQWSNG